MSKLIVAVSCLAVIPFATPSSAVAPTSPYTWQLSGPYSTRFSGVASSKTGAVVYAVPDQAYGTGVARKGYKSVDHGATWSELSSMENRFWYFVDTSANGQVVFATGSVYVSGQEQSAVFRSTDSGTSWTEVISFNPATPSVVYRDVSISEDGNKVAVAATDGVRYSSNQGATWTTIRTGDTASVAISGNGSVIVAAERYGPIRKTTDFGSNWTDVYATVRAWTNLELSTNGQSVFASATRQDPTPGGAYFSQDGGATWTDANLNSTLSDNQYATGSMSPDGNTMIMTSYYSEPRMSVDAGATWTILPSEVVNAVEEGWTGFAVADPDSSSTLNSVEARVVAITEDRGIVRFGLRPPPVIDGIYRERGRISGGRTVEIVGDNLTGTTSVTFDGVAATSFQIIDDEGIHAVSPAHAAGAVQLTVTTPIGSVSTTYTYVDFPAPTITSIVPSRVAVGVFSALILEGTNFTDGVHSEDLLTVNIDGTPTEYIVVSPTELFVFGIDRPAGTYTVEVITETGTASTSLVFDPSVVVAERPNTILTSFNPTNAPDQEINSLQIHPGGGLVVVGQFQNAGGDAAADCIARWDGSTWHGFGSDGSRNGAIDCDSGFHEIDDVSFTADGRAYVYGYFEIRGDSTPYAVAMWNGSTWTGILAASLIDSDIHGLSAVSAGEVYLYGDFGTITGYPGTEFLALWDGTTWRSKNAVNGVSAFNDPVTSLVVSPTGAVYASGWFEDAGGDVNADHLAKWNGTAWTSVGDNGSGGSKYPNGGFRPLAVRTVDGVDELFVGSSLYGLSSVSGVDVFRNGAWSRIASSRWGSVFGQLSFAPSGALVAAGFINDSTTRHYDSIGILSGDSWRGFSASTSLSRDSGFFFSFVIDRDGTVYVVKPDSAGGVGSSMIMRFYAVEGLAAAVPVPVQTLEPVVTSLPRTGATPVTGYAAWFLLLGGFLRLISVRRRIRVR